MYFYKAEEKHEKKLGHLLVVASKIASQQNLLKGWRLVVNVDIEGGQTIYHLHFHIIGGRQMGWPPG